MASPRPPAEQIRAISPQTSLPALSPEQIKPRSRMRAVKQQCLRNLHSFPMLPRGIGSGAAKACQFAAYGVLAKGNTPKNFDQPPWLAAGCDDCPALSRAGGPLQIARLIYVTGGATRFCIPRTQRDLLKTD